MNKIEKQKDFIIKWLGVGPDSWIDKNGKGHNTKTMSPAHYLGAIQWITKEEKAMKEYKELMRDNSMRDTLDMMLNMSIEEVKKVMTPEVYEGVLEVANDSQKVVIDAIASQIMKEEEKEMEN